MSTHRPSRETWREALWVAAIVVASLAFSRAFACATPFAALATLAAVRMSRRAGFAAVIVAWIANQAVGFLLLGYPHMASTFVWGGAIGAAAVAAFLAANLASRPAWPQLARIGVAFVSAFAAYEIALLATAFAMHAGTGAFTAAIVGRIFAVDAVALVGLLALYEAARAVGWLVPVHGRAPARA